MTGRRPELGGLRELQEFDSNRRRRRGVRVYGRGREAPPGQGQGQPDQRQGEDAVAPTLALGSPGGAVGSRAVGRLSGPLGRLPVLTSLGFYLLLVLASHIKAFSSSAPSLTFYRVLCNMGTFSASGNARRRSVLSLGDIVCGFQGCVSPSFSKFRASVLFPMNLVVYSVT